MTDLNAYRSKKIKEIDRLKREYKTLTLEEQFDAVALELEVKVEMNDDITERGSVNEYCPAFQGLYLDKFGRPAKWAKYFMNVFIGRRRRFFERHFPKEKIYKLPNQETNDKGRNIKRWYVAFVKGKPEVDDVNGRLQIEVQRLGEIIESNKTAYDKRSVRRSIQQHLDWLRNKRGGAGIT